MEEKENVICSHARGSPFSRAIPPDVRLENDIFAESTVSSFLLCLFLKPCTALTNGGTAGNSGSC